MPRYCETRAEPYSAEQMFDLVADVERYPAFLPAWRDVRIVRRGGDRLEVEQVLGHGPLAFTLRTTATLDRPRRIEIVSREPPFRTLAITWRFVPAGRGCRIHFTVDYALAPHLALRPITRLFAQNARAMVEAFEQRAQALYGAAPGVRREPR